MRTSPVDKFCELLAEHVMKSRVPFRLPQPPFDSPDVFEILGLHKGDAPVVTTGPASRGNRPEHDVIPFTFPSRVELEWPEVNTVFGELYLLPDRRPARVCVLIHGNGSPSPKYERMRARQLLKAGVHALSFRWAGHAPRLPVGERKAEHTLANDLHGCVQTFVQAASDAADLVRWLREQSWATEVGMAGWSGGGITTMLAMTLVELDFAMPVVPATDFATVLWSPYVPKNVQETIRQELGSYERLDEAVRAIAAWARTPKVPADPARFLLLPGSLDEVCGTEATRRTWEAWGRPPIEWTRYGHVMGAAMPVVGKRLVSIATGGRPQ